MNAWRRLVLLARLLFVCRISVVSAVGGILLFGFVVQAQDLLADLSHGGTAAATWHWAKVLVFLWLLWAFPVHYAARRAVEDDGWIVRASLRRRLPHYEVARIVSEVRFDHAFTMRWLPRLLGVLPFVAVLIGLWRVHDSVSRVQIDEAGRTTTLVIGLGLGCIAAALLFVLFVILRRRLLRRWAERRARRDALAGRIRHRDPFAVLTWVCLTASAALFVLAYFAPIVIGALAPRAALVPLLLGSLVLPLGLLGRFAHRHGVPYLLLVGLACALLTGFNLRFNDLRGVPVALAPTADRQVDLVDAVARWRRANRCEGARACPPALILAADGGASRAAFMTATVAGAILDQAAGEPGGDPGRRLFAISGVSGGAVGATLVRAALADAAESAAPDSPPCRRVHRTWYRAPELWRAGGVPRTWRECLQVLAAGDFLSPAFVGLAFRDNLAPPLDLVSPRLRIDDRAVLLEQALERHYAYVTAAAGNGWLETGEPCADDRPGRGLCRLFGYQGRGERWLPLLALNGTSVHTGRRIVTGDLRSSVGGKDALYAQAYDLIEMRATPCSAPTSGPDTRACPLPQALDAPHLFLSTAAVTSARFPVISPAGVIATGSHTLHGDAVVDGGYFENGGLTTALDIARALAEQGVTPMILSIVNEPEVVRLNEETPPRPVVTPTIGKIDERDAWRGLPARMFGVLGAPLDTLLGTRGGHGAEARDRVVRRLPELQEVALAAAARLGLPAARRENLYFSVSMRAVAAAEPSPPKDRCPGRDRAIGMPKLSMSWWLSAVVQADIDVQVLCTRRNKETLRDLFAALDLDPTIRQ